MKVLLISMPDVAPIIIHETAVHLPNHGIASIGGNIDENHDVYIIDLVRKRSSIKSYLTKMLRKLQPDLIGLSAMTWQYNTCIKLAHFIKTLAPKSKIVIGGYHATLLYEEIAKSEDARWFDFMIRGEGEEAFRRLVNALSGQENLADIPSLSYRENGSFTHNIQGENLDLSKLKLPIRDKRRLTWGYHVVSSKIELLETSRGCTRSCNFCSMKHMYGRSFRMYPIQRVLDDIDDIYHHKKTRSIFITDDNIVLNPSRLMDLCDAIIAKGYKGLKFFVQADCATMAKKEDMVAKMAEAGFSSIFLGIENISKDNLKSVNKDNAATFAKKAIDNCHKYGMMVIGGLIFGFPEDNEETIRQNYMFFKAIEADTAYCQVLTPYPKTGIREDLINQGLVTNLHDYRKYNGLWANVRTHHLDTEQLQYQFWYQRQIVLGWWKPPQRMKDKGWAWIFVWRFAFKPLLKIRYWIVMRKYGWKGRYNREIQRWKDMNIFYDLNKL